VRFIIYVDLLPVAGGCEERRQVKVWVVLVYGCGVSGWRWKVRNTMGK